MRCPGPELERFAAAVLTAAGADAREAAEVARALVWADAAGRTEQGVRRLDMLTTRLERGLLMSPAAFEWSGRGAVAHLDAADGFGHLALTAAADRAGDLAREHGVGVVTVRRSNLAGAIGYGAWRLAERGLVALVTSNACPKVAAHGGTGPVLGTNPLAFAAPGPDRRHLLVDLSTAALAGSEVRRLDAEGRPLPSGVAITPDGAPLTDPARLHEGALLPMAGARGYALGLMVEVLSGVITGAAMATGVGSAYADHTRASDNGHLVLALDPAGWLGADTLLQRMAHLTQVVTGSGDGVRLPGDARRQALADSEHGIPLGGSLVDALQRLASRYEVPFSVA